VVLIYLQQVECAIFVLQVLSVLVLPLILWPVLLANTQDWVKLHAIIVLLTSTVLMLKLLSLFLVLLVIIQLPELLSAQDAL
jgi:hypothetical protein